MLNLRSASVVALTAASLALLGAGCPDEQRDRGQPTFPERRQPGQTAPQQPGQTPPPQQPPQQEQSGTGPQYQPDRQ